MSFWESSFLWLDAVVASVALATACAFVGVYMVMRRVVFLPAAISQVAGLGVAVALLLGAHLHELHDAWILDPAVIATAVSLVAALALGWAPEPKRLSREALTGIAYVAASALVVIVGSLAPHESHDVKDLLFGNAVMVERARMWRAVVVSGLVLAGHLVLLEPFLMVSFDRRTAKAHGVPVGLVDGALFLSLGLIAAQATRTLGALPVFAFTVLPAAAALSLTSQMRRAFALAALFGAASAFLGYWASFVLSLPTGSSMAAVAGAIYLVAALSRALIGLWRPRRARR